MLFAIYRALASLVLTVLLAGTAHAHDQDFGAWFAIAGQGRLTSAPDSRWRWWFDNHFRTFEDSDGFDTSIVRPGLGYDLGKGATIWLGYGWVHTDPPSGSNTDEHRIWQQLTWSTKLGERKLYDLFVRSRLEQRWLEGENDTGWRYRQFLRIVRPIAPRSRWTVRVWNELFLPMNDTDWGARAGFGQNRAFAGLGVALDAKRRVTLESGYLNQLINRRGTDAMNHIFSLSLLLSF